MLHDAITAYIEDDEAAARAIVARDDEVDALYDQIYRELLTFMLADPTTINQATHLLWAAHNLERIADRVDQYLRAGRLCGDRAARGTSGLHLLSAGETTSGLSIPLLCHLVKFVLNRRLRLPDSTSHGIDCPGQHLVNVHPPGCARIGVRIWSL